ncbi:MULTISPECIES: MFS transporter [unclassified Streptomyces]|uniref:MFS transporter n=1 Tax=unclassified Streptomyces TaxID=2593676 RepID=UPI002E7A4445|nr:MFS transporter [Streptomyces sp. JV176]MEE1801067.1 MFS transporter [Streptomyces sp. JV176]
MTATSPSPDRTSSVPPEKETAPSGSRRVLVSAYLGSVMEWYDFLLYGTASALVFNKLFFPELSTTAGTLASFGTLAVGYGARPLGGILFGHFGDRLGRKSMLVTSILLMGVASTLIGLLPTYNTIGIWAPAALVLLRLVQGFAVGGEWGGAVLMTVEHSGKGRRGLWSSVAQMGAPTGLLLSTLVFSLAARLPESAFMSWGWRVPFLMTIFLATVGLWIRLGVSETPAFTAAQAELAAKRERGERTRPPLVELLRTQPRQLLLASLIGFGPFAANSVLITFVISYATQVGHSRSTALNGLMVASAVSLVCLPLAAALSDRVGRRPVYLAGAVLLGLNSFLLFPLVNAQSTGLFLLGYGLALGLHSLMYGPMGAFLAELFGTGTRYTGASLGYQIASVAGGALAPIAATSLLAAGGGAPHAVYVSCFMAGACAVTAVAVLLTRETHQKDLGA